jgi:hypothetical protein
MSKWMSEVLKAVNQSEKSFVDSLIEEQQDNTGLEDFEGEY